MNWIKIFNNNFKRSTRKKSTFLITLIFPIIVVIVGVMSNYMSRPSFNIGVLKSYKDEIILNEHQSKIDDAIVQTLENTKGINVEIANPETVKTDTITGKYSVVIDFNDDSFDLYSVKDKSTVDILNNLIERYKVKPVPIDINLIQKTTLGISQRIVAFIVLFLMITSTVTASIIIKDKNSGTFKRFLYSPQNLNIYVFGNIVYNFTITYFQYLVSVSIIALFKVDIGISYIDLLLIGIWITSLATAFGTFMSSLFKNEMHSNLFSTCIALILSLIGGTFIPIDKMPTMLQHISIVSPSRWFISATAYMAEGKSWFYSLDYICVLTVFIVVLFLLAIRSNKKTKFI